MYEKIIFLFIIFSVFNSCSSTKIYDNRNVQSEIRNATPSDINHKL